MMEPAHIIKARRVAMELNDTSSECLLALVEISDYERDVQIARLESELSIVWKLTDELFGMLEAHEVETLDCDRRGERYCDCLERLKARYRTMKGIT